MSQSAIYGVHAVKEAFTAGKELIKVIVQKGIQNTQIDEIMSLCRQNQVPIQYVPREKFYSFKDKNHQGIVGYISPISYHSIEQLVPQLFEEGKTPYLVILDKLTDVKKLRSNSQNRTLRGCTCNCYSSNR